MARSLYRSITERLLALPDHLLLYPAHYAGLGLRRAVSQAIRPRPIGFERRHNEALSSLRGRVRRGADRRTSRPAPEHQAEIVAANRSGRPAASLERDAGRARAAREPAQFSLLVAVNALVGAMVGLERSTLPLIGETSSVWLERRGALVHRRLRPGQVVHQPRRRRLAERIGRRRCC